MIHLSRTSKVQRGLMSPKTISSFDLNFYTLMTAINIYQDEKGKFEKKNMKRSKNSHTS